MALDSAIIVGLIAAGAAAFGAGITVFTAKIGAGPNVTNAQTARFTALIDRQDIERKALLDEFEWRTLDQAQKMEKLERVTADLEAMVVRFIEWADEVTLVALQRGVELPPRPKFPHVVAG